MQPELQRTDAYIVYIIVKPTAVSGRGECRDIRRDLSKSLFALRKERSATTRPRLRRSGVSRFAERNATELSDLLLPQHHEAEQIANLVFRELIQHAIGHQGFAGIPRLFDLTASQCDLFPVGLNHQSLIGC